ncbi:MAG: tetratricopeptide repeat protein, partial [Verrucomicrobiota bacterium]
VEAASVDEPEAVIIDEGGAALDAEGESGDTSTTTATFVSAGAATSSVFDPNAVVEGQSVAIELSQIDKSARLDFQEGRYSEAEAGFLEYLRYRPRSVACLCNLGVLKIAMKNFSEAEYFLEKAIAIDAESGLAYYLLGRTYFLQGKLDDALDKLEVGLTHDPQNAKAHNSVGVISSKKGWVTRAERAFTNAVSIDPKYGDAHFNLAVLYATRDEPNPKAAGKHYFEALDLGVPRDATIEEFLEEAEAAGTSIGMR